jgi:hypothetical protein
MTTTLTPASIASLGKLADLLDLIASLRNLSDPFSSSEALRAALEALGRLAATLGVEDDWLTWLRAIEDNPALLDLIVAAGRFVENLLHSGPTGTGGASGTHPTPGHSVTIQAVPLADWLTLITQLIAVLQKLRIPK